MQETDMKVRIYLITDAIVSIVSTRLCLPTETLLKKLQTGMQLELYYEWLGQTLHLMWVGLATIARTTWTTLNNLKALLKFEFSLQR